MVAAETMAALVSIIERFRRLRVAVVGDAAADEYVIGRPARISREAPVLILEYTESFFRPGGAANTAYNLARLGAAVTMVGTVGEDRMGAILCDELRRTGINVSGITIDPDRPTARKTRILARGTQEAQQQIVRIDRVASGDVAAPTRDSMIGAARAALAHCHALLVSDYENGVISPEVIDACLPEARRRNLTVVADSHGDLYRFKGITAATPNQPEASATIGRALRSDEDVDAAGWELVARLEAGAVLITRGSEGVALYERDRPPFRLPVVVREGREVVDPTGAGDTVAAVFTLCLAAGASFRQAAFLSNVAGGEAVRRLGAAAITAEELRRALAATYLPCDCL